MVHRQIMGEKTWRPGMKQWLTSMFPAYPYSIIEELNAKLLATASSEKFLLGYYGYDSTFAERENLASDRVWNQPCHPVQNTSEHQQRVILLGLKDPNIPFPVCPPGDAGISLLRWRMLSTDEPVVPLTINCWPSVCGGARFVSMEYEASTMFNLHNVVSKCEPGGNDLLGNKSQIADQVMGHGNLSLKDCYVRLGTKLIAVYQLVSTRTSAVPVVPDSEGSENVFVVLFFGERAKAKLMKICDHLEQTITHSLRKS
ncbi:hypothetical protein C5167_016356 [Papaver somniferum]|nr:hypothetical protein C5167_016356 [Papaver somniferum]